MDKIIVAKKIASSTPFVSSLITPKTTSFISTKGIRFFSTELSKSKYPTFTIGLIPGDGIGKEVLPCAERLLQAIPEDSIQANFRFVTLDAGLETFKKTGTALPQETIDQLKKCNGALFGVTTSPVDSKIEGYTNPLIGIRKAFDLYANVQPVTSIPILNTKGGVDMVIVRENTDFYRNKERVEDKGETAISEIFTTRKASLRVAELAFKLATQRKSERNIRTKKKAMVTIAHKSDVLTSTDGFFRDCCLEVAKRYPDILVEEQLINSLVHKLILNPTSYDIIVTPNLYGDILSDASAALVGGLGIIPSINLGDYYSVGEPAHGSSLGASGKIIANPISSLRSASMLLQTLLGLPNPKKVCDAIEESISHTIRTGTKTADLGGRMNAHQVTGSIISMMCEVLARK